MLLQTNSTNTELLSNMYNHHNFPKTLVMTPFNNLKLTTAADSIYTAKADFYILYAYPVLSLCQLLQSLLMPTEPSHWLLGHLSQIPYFPTLVKSCSIVAILKSTKGFCLLKKKGLPNYLTVHAHIQ